MDMDIESYWSEQKRILLAKANIMQENKKKCW